MTVLLCCYTAVNLMLQLKDYINLGTKSCVVIIQIKPCWQNFCIVLFISQDFKEK